MILGRDSQGALSPPRIAFRPVSESDTRPLWSVMIPTFNCANYLRATLQSVLSQAPGPEIMQIEVVDDCSTKDDPERVVREIAGDRVLFYRRPENGGANANFNTCIERSRGELIHILHGDDWVADCFYQEMGALADLHRDAAILACRCFYVDHEGVILNVSPRARSLEQPSRSAADFYYSPVFHFPGVVIRRNFYERYGGYIPELVHASDNEMWARAWFYGTGVMVPHVWSYYRTFSENDTSRLMRTAENLRDLQRLNAVLSARHSEFSRERGTKRVAIVAREQLRRFADSGDSEAFDANYGWWRKNVGIAFRVKSAGVRFLRSLSW